MTMILKPRQLGIYLQKRKGGGMRYEGRVYDGPWEGRNYASERPWFEVPMMPPRSLDWRFPGTEPIVPLTIEVKRYRWSAPLRAWVLESGT